MAAAREHLANLIHAVLVGALIGLGLAGVEYLVLSRNLAFSADRAAYLEIAAPYAVVGACGGVLAWLANLGVTRVFPSYGRSLASLWSTLISATLFAYLVLWSTYALGRPVVKVANVLAYLGSAILAVIVAVLVRRLTGALLSRIDGHAVRRKQWMRVGVPFASLLLLGAALALPYLYTARANVTPAATARPGNVAQQGFPNVIFILIDATRADHLSLYGYSRETDRNLKALARQGMTFTRMYAQAASTRPSVATIFSSLYPAVHKANEDRDFFSHALPVLPEILQAAGYATFGISANANVSPTFGYDQGFDEFRVWKTESVFRLTRLGHFAEDLLGSPALARLLGEHQVLVPTAESITDAALSWSSQRGDRPAFMYIHYIDPHHPYRPPPPFDRAFDYRRDPPIRRTGAADPLALIPPDVDRDRVGRILDLYDGEILYADHHVARLLAGLRGQGVLDNALVIVTADHGEEFYEHGQDSHGRSAYEEVLWVPFFMVWPGKIPAASTYREIVGHIDIMPTILDLLGLQPPPLVQGTSFSPVFSKPDDQARPRTIFAQVFQNAFGIEMARDDRYKFVRHTYGPRRGEEEFYDLIHDPLERRNLVADANAAQLRKELLTFNDVVGRASSLTQPERVKRLDRDTERALRSLGYIK